MADSRQVRPTLEGYPLWAVERYAKLSGKREGPALATLIDRWLDFDAEYLKRFGISWEDYWRETGRDEDAHPPTDKAESKNKPAKKPN